MHGTNQPRSGATTDGGLEVGGVEEYNLVIGIIQGSATTLTIKGDEIINEFINIYLNCFGLYVEHIMRRGGRG